VPNLLSDMFAGIADILGGRAGSYEGNLQAAKERGANWVLGIKIDYEAIRDTLLMVAAAGTAARIDREGIG